MAAHCNPRTPISRFSTLSTLAGLLVFLGSSTLAGIATLAALPGVAGAQEPDPRWNFKGWTPSLAVSLGVHATDMSGFVIATDSSGDTIRPPNDSTDYAVTPMLRLSLGLETPELPRVPGRIRLFGSLDYFVTFPPDRNIAGERDPSGFSIKEGFANPPKEAIEGVGSETAVKTNRSAYGLTGGVSIPVDVGEFRFFVKTGVSWMRYQWDIRGTVLEAVKPPSLVGRNFRGVELRSRGKLWSTGVGPYMAIEMEPDHWGPVLASAFVEGAYYRTLGDRDANITTFRSYAGDGLPPETYQGRWGLKLDDEFWRAAAGIRIFLASD